MPGWVPLRFHPMAGFYPPFSAISLPHPVPLDLWDPFGFTKKMTPYARHAPNKSDNFPLC